METKKRREDPEWGFFDVMSENDNVLSERTPTGLVQQHPDSEESNQTPLEFLLRAFLTPLVYVPMVPIDAVISRKLGSGTYDFWTEPECVLFEIPSAECTLNVPASLSLLFWFSVVAIGMFVLCMLYQRRYRILFGYGVIILALLKMLRQSRDIYYGTDEVYENVALREEMTALCFYFGVSFFISYPWIILDVSYRLPFRPDSKFGAKKLSDVRKRVACVWFWIKYFKISTMPAILISVILSVSNNLAWKQWLYNLVMLMDVFLLIFVYLAASTYLPETCHTCTRAVDDADLMRESDSKRED